MFTEGICQDGAAILNDGVMVPIEEIIDRLNASVDFAPLYALIDSKPYENSVVTVHKIRQALMEAVAPCWSKTVPNESGYWWWWNEDGWPIPVNIEVSLTDGPRYFATQGQHGWNRFQWVEDMGGYWMRLTEPPLPKSV